MSRLVDICRQCIIFNNLDDLSSCLEALATDSDIRVVRVKNRLHTMYDASASGGYRDVAVNLCITSPKSVELGVDGHVCEMQLILRPYAELKVLLLTLHNSQ